MREIRQNLFLIQDTEGFMALSIPTITLNDGRAMPLLGLGTYKSTEKEAEKQLSPRQNTATV